MQQSQLLCPETASNSDENIHACGMSHVSGIHLLHILKLDTTT